MWYEKLVYKGLFPDAVIRRVIRWQLKRYHNKISKLSDIDLTEIRAEFLKSTSTGAIAIETQKANLQHYEFSTSFYQNILGPSLKYSGSIWNEDHHHVADADLATLKIYSDRAVIQNGQSILDLGCGWGSLALYLGKKFNRSNITAITNSNTQEAYVNSQINKHRLDNVRVIKVDINNFSPKGKYDRILSIEMFEHTRNTSMLMKNIDGWLSKTGKLFIQVFGHNSFPQFFDNHSNSWMARNFFSGGMMPYKGYHKEIAGNLKFNKQWIASGVNYHKTLESWLKNLDNSKNKIMSELSRSDDSKELEVAIYKFRIFLIFCSELFKYHEGKSWQIINYLFSKNEGNGH